MNNMKFSVSMSVYKLDNPDWLETAIESILNSTVKPDEIVLVVDGPVGGELDVLISKYEENPIFKVIRLEENQGLGNALRIAIENCSNELIARMDSDDINLPNRFEEQLKYFEENENLDVLSGDITEFIDTEDNIVGRRCVPKTNEEIKEYMKTRCALNHVATMYKKSAVLQAGNYMDWFCNEDYYLWVRMLENGCTFGNTGTDLVNVRVGNEMYNRRGGMAYFKSEANLQKYMLDKKIINFKTYLINVLKRLIVQVLLPNKLRGWVFKKFAREEA